MIAILKYDISKWAARLLPDGFKSEKIRRKGFRLVCPGRQREAGCSRDIFQRRAVEPEGLPPPRGMTAEHEIVIGTHEHPHVVERGLEHGAVPRAGRYVAAVERDRPRARKQSRSGHVSSRSTPVATCVPSECPARMICRAHGSPDTARIRARMRTPAVSARRSCQRQTAAL